MWILNFKSFFIKRKEKIYLSKELYVNNNQMLVIFSNNTLMTNFSFLIDEWWFEIT